MTSTPHGECHHLVIITSSNYYVPPMPMLLGYDLMFDIYIDNSKSLTRIYVPLYINMKSSFTNREKRHNKRVCFGNAKGGDCDFKKCCSDMFSGANEHTGEGTGQ